MVVAARGGARAIVHGASALSGVIMDFSRIYERPGEDNFVSFSGDVCDFTREAR